MEELIKKPNRYCYLDAAQLVKHAFGIGRTLGQDATLLYLYWEPRNADTIREIIEHRDEVARFRIDVMDARPSFKAISYRDLWNLWEQLTIPPWLSEHLVALRSRYDFEI
jgi:hypothetical protein